MNPFSARNTWMKRIEGVTGLVQSRKYYCPRQLTDQDGESSHIEIHTIIRKRIFILSKRTQQLDGVEMSIFERVELYFVPTGFTPFCFSVWILFSVENRIYTDSIVSPQTRQIFNSLFCFCKDKSSRSLKRPFKPFFARKTRVDRTQWEIL